MQNPFRELPASGDALEVIWGIEWYHDALFVSHRSPLFDPLIFHPTGWHTATLAHTPALFLVAQPFRIIGGPVFAYNALVVLSFIVVYAGCLRLFRLFHSSAAIIAAGSAVYTFMNFRWFRISGHQNVLWASALLPWFMYGLERIRRKEPPGISDVAFAGVIWAAMIHVSLYSVFLAPIAFVGWGLDLFAWRRLKVALAVGLVALIIAAPTLILYEVGKRADGMESFSVQELVTWSASINALPLPSVFHPLTPIRRLGESGYKGPRDETGRLSLGLCTVLLAICGLVVVSRSHRQYLRIAAVSAAGLVLSLGVFVRWNGDVVTVPTFGAVDRLLWRAGHALKPDVFVSAEVPAEFQSGLPLPGYGLAILVPFWEAGRVAARYALVAELGLIVLAGFALRALPRPVLFCVLAVWLAESLPEPTERVVLPATAHPAHQWLAAQKLNSSEGILDLDSSGLMVGPEIGLGTIYDQTATAAGMGSSRPSHIRMLAEKLKDPVDWNSDMSRLLRNEYGVRYLLVHMRTGNEWEFWRRMGTSSALRPVECFESKGTPLWTYPMCIAEVRP